MTDADRAAFGKLAADEAETAAALLLGRRTEEWFGGGLEHSRGRMGGPPERDAEARGERLFDGVPATGLSLRDVRRAGDGLVLQVYET